MPLGGALTGALIPAIVLWTDWKTAALSVGAVALAIMVLLQIGGFAGRLLWGGIASRTRAPRAVLVIIGLITAACLVVTPSMNAEWPLSAVIALATLTGASSLGWNGVLLSEVATHAPEGLAVDATAGMQVVMFGGITVVPPLFGYLVTRSGEFGASFVAVAALAVAGALLMSRMPRS